MAKVLRRRKEQPWGPEPWEVYLKRQTEKAQVWVRRAEEAEAEVERLLAVLQDIEGDLRTAYRRTPENPNVGCSWREGTVRADGRS